MGKGKFGIRKHVTKLNIFCASLAIMLVTLTGYARLAQPSNAAPGGGSARSAQADVQSADKFQKFVYFNAGAKTMVSGGAGTAVSSGSKCGVAGLLHGSVVTITGTLSGTNPTLDFTWQNSKDGGSTWTTVGAFTQVNATVTPSSLSQTVADIIGSTAVAYGDCWRILYTWGGTGSVGGSFGIKGFEK